jgi:hypothetical protein
LGGHVLESLYQLQASLAASYNLTDVSARQKFLNFREEAGPLLREIADDNVLECGGKLDGDRSGGSRSKETEEVRLECLTIGLRNRGTIRSNLRGINIVAGVNAIFEPNGTCLTGGTAITSSMNVRGVVEDASNTNLSTPSVDIILKSAVTTPSWPAI